MNKKKIITILVAVLVIILSLFTYHYVTKEDKVSTLNLFEKQWIESNKNNVIDMSIVNNIPILSYNGEGLIVDFLDSLKDATGLSFNKISYKLGEEIKSSYAIKMVDSIGENDILIYQDNYVVLSKGVDKYNSIEQLKGLKIGVLDGDLANVNTYLYDAEVSYQTYQNIDKLLEEFLKADTDLSGIILLKTTNLKTILENNFSISYNIADYQKYFVLSLGETEKLNDILTKYYKKWSGENYQECYYKHLANNYFNLNEITDSESVKFRSKRYIYGYIENTPYETVLDSKLVGINNNLLKTFSKLTNAEISTKRYSNMKELLDAFNSNQIDFFYGINSEVEYKLDIKKTSGAYDNKLVVLKSVDNNMIINTIKSIKKASVIKDSALEKYLKDNGIEVTSFNNIDELIQNATKDSVLVVDLQNYNGIKDSLKSFTIAYIKDITDYSFVIRNISDNAVFSELLDFYIRFQDTQKSVNEGLKEVVLIDKTPMILKNVAFILGIIVCLLLIVLGIIKLKPKKDKVVLTKEDKLRYIDALTSLKNRNYLNDSVERWDDSEVYPQTVIIIDLNNIAYINDNYGHTEGDEVIRQAANILIMNQIENSEIIRTNGNEFLIYLVGHEEKQVITYMRKLNKELKELKHNFGAALGYSMINDAIKTIDDAINEATLDMRSNKEEAIKD